MRVQLVALNGRALLSQSEWIDLPSDFPPIKSVGVYSKDGSARVYPFQWGGEPLYPVMDKAPVKNTEAAPERGSSEQPAAQGLGTGWRILNGTWTWVEAGKVLGCGGGKGESRVLSTDIKGVLGIWHGDIVPSDGTEAVGLLFQADPEQKEGFLCRVTRDKCALETLAGSILWEVSHGALKPGEHVRIDGIVRTDRVSVRITGEKGEVIAVSPERYVSDKNNTRNGFLGFMGENGKVSCEGFSFKTE